MVRTQIQLTEEQVQILKTLALERGVSMVDTSVDCISFETARRLGINNVFAFDQHFVEQGFTYLS